ncbi:MAG TPA: Gfo/Idh/MocA family oxidoreductase [Planctomycetota bacterium]|nr:Gfo/Idh/MocA family oxidoreductase [Planctomycetota bacterium]
MSIRSRPRVVVIGAGYISWLYHLRSVQHLAARGRCTFAAICDLDATLAARAARTFAAQRWYTDVDTMLSAEKPDGVVVITPIAATARVAGAVLRRGYPVLMEKPPGGSSRECRQLIRAAASTRAPNCVSFNRRFSPVLAQGRDAVRAYGPVKGASARMFRRGRPDPLFFLQTGIHSLDALRHLGGEIAKVAMDRRVMGTDQRPAYALIITYENGAMGTLEVRPEAGLDLERYELFGADSVAIMRSGMGHLIDRPGSCDVYRDGKAVRLPDPLAPFRRMDAKLHEAASGGFYGAQAHFVDALRTGGRLSPTVEESLRSVEIAEAVQAGRDWTARRARTRRGPR